MEPPSLRLLNGSRHLAGIFALGEWILENRAIPHHDLFSNVTTRPWFAWEWLFDIWVAKVHAWWGLNGVLAGGAIVIALTFALLPTHDPAAGGAAAARNGVSSSSLLSHSPP